MGDGLEILFWLAIFVVVGLRGVARGRKGRAPPEPGIEPPLALEPVSREAPRETQPARQPARQPERQAVRQPARQPAQKSRQKVGGLRGRWAEFAAELERQMVETQQSAPEGPAELAEPSSERTVVAPRSPAPADTGPDVPPRRDVLESPWAAPEAVRKPAARRPRRRGLTRLERYGSLKRAVILSEILGTAPGLEGGAPAEKRWKREG